MQPRSIATRQRLIAVALYLFAQQGYDVTSVAQICHAANVSKGAFYHHFPTKHALFQAALDDWLESIDQQLDRTRDMGGSVPEILSQMTAMLPNIYQAAAGHLPMFLELWTHAYRDPELLRAVVYPHQRYQEYFTEIMRAGIQEGSLAEIDPEIAARMVVALAVGLLLEGLVNPEAADWQTVAQESVHYLMHGLLRRQT